ncbi:MAG: hypothetical protein DHS20C16_22000 [Phycisphaerae bacterium]|nr:MAG: hypothetical protein DHS20C16_22000 [Phycisphaerae bacterium]
MKATLDDTDVTIHEAAFDGLGRRVVKTVSNSGDLDGVTEYYHNSNQIIETRDGSGNLETQVYHGTQYIDEVVGQRIANMGRVYVHQDANYNVTGTTDLTARQIERNYYSPYGQLEVAVDSHPFDYDDDGDVDADDYAVTTNGICTGIATGDCRRMDADADGDVDSTDQITISSYIATLTTDTELARIPAATESQRGLLFAAQGLSFDSETTSYHVGTGNLVLSQLRLGSRTRNGIEFPANADSNPYGFAGFSPQSQTANAEDCGAEVHQTPFCLFGDPGHTWIEWPGRQGGFDVPANYIENHPCQKNDDYVNNKWRLKRKDEGNLENGQSCSAASCQDIQDCLNDYEEDHDDDFNFCKKPGFICNPREPEFTCRDFAEDAADECCLSRDLLPFDVNILAPFNYCSSNCANCGSETCP